MPRTVIKGQHICDGSIDTVDLADGAVTTPKIEDRSVTCAKLTADICPRLLATDSPIARVRIAGATPAHTDITIPGGLSYSSVTEFLERFLISVDGQIMWSFASFPPASPTDPCDVYPGSDGTKIRFAFSLDKGTRLQVVQL